MNLKDHITNDMKSAMKARETEKLGAIRLLQAAIKQKEVDTREVLDDAAILAIIDKQIKQRKDSVSQYTAAARQDLADKEQFEISVLSVYLPAALSVTEINAVIAAAILETGAVSAADLGKLMTKLKPILTGKADMAEVSRLAKVALSKP